jgi:OFA family oxalate/formate antiporter-like MFS transporter
MAWVVLLSLAAVSALAVAITAGQFFLIPLGFILSGFAFGGVPTCVSALTAGFYGMKYYSVNYPLICTNLIFASFSSTVAGRLYDLSGSYASTMFMAGAASVLSGLCLLGVHAPRAGISAESYRKVEL